MNNEDIILELKARWKIRISYLKTRDWHLPYRDKAEELERCLKELKVALAGRRHKASERGLTLCQVFGKEISKPTETWNDAKRKRKL